MEIEELTARLTAVRLRQHDSSHCALRVGDSVSSYKIFEKLGRGRFSTVYKVFNETTGSSAALKLYRAGRGNEKHYKNEILILNTIFEKTNIINISQPNIIGYHGACAHVAFTRELLPEIYPAIIFELGGDTVYALIEYCNRRDMRIPLNIVKTIMRDVLRGLCFLHSCNIIHADIKPANLLLNAKVEEMHEDNIRVKIGDFGSSTFAHDIFSYHVGTVPYIAPELITDQPSYNTAIDIWSAFVMCFELITGDLLFDVYGECGIDYGELMSYNNSSSEASTDRNESGASCTGSNATCTGSTSSDEDAETINNLHLFLIEKVLGPPSHAFTATAQAYYDRCGKLKYKPNVNHISITELLHNNYQFDLALCHEIEQFLLCGLKYMPDERITAAEALQHPFLRI